VNAASVDNSYKWAGGGFLSTVGDLVGFGNAMLYSYQAGSVKGYGALQYAACPQTSTDPINVGQVPLWSVYTVRQMCCEFCVVRHFLMSYNTTKIGLILFFVWHVVRHPPSVGLCK
jgi:hypothetical protein